MKQPLCLTAFAALALATCAGDALLKIFPSQHDRLLASENFAGPPAKPVLEDVFRANKLAELDVTIEQAIKEGMIVGGALWVERDGTAYHKAFGNRAIEPEPVLMTKDTPSCSEHRALLTCQTCLHRGY